MRRLDKEGREDWTQRYEALMQHYKMTPTTNNVGVAHENGDVEQSHYRFQQAVDQALRVRGSRDFADRAGYERFLQDLVRYRNQTRTGRYAQEQQALRPLPAQPLAPCRELRVSVSRFSTIVVQGNTYSLPSRLVGTTLLMRVRAEHLEGYLGSKQVVTLPRLHGRGQHAINYHHLIWSLVRKPGAFAAYRYRDDLYPSLAFRRAYDRLTCAPSARAVSYVCAGPASGGNALRGRGGDRAAALGGSRHSADCGCRTRSGPPNRCATGGSCASQFAALRPVAAITEVRPCLIDRKN